jgi:hypothetical protein
MNAHKGYVSHASMRKMKQKVPHPRMRKAEAIFSHEFMGGTKILLVLMRPK